MNDNLVLGLFRELAVLREQRTPEGEWTVSQDEMRQTLKEAMRMVDFLTENLEAEKEAISRT